MGGLGQEKADKDFEKAHDDLLSGELNQRSESFRNFVQYEKLQENIEINDNNKEIETRLNGTTNDSSPTLYRRESKPSARISLMKTQSPVFEVTPP